MSTPGVPRPGLILHLSGPVQSWGEKSKFNERDTGRAPTRSGLLGLVASALGRRRGESIADLAALQFATRADRSGTLLRDFHTVGGGLPREQTIATADGGRRQEGATTLVSTRYYLQDAAFTVAVTAAGDDQDLLSRCATALQDPHWPPYLGRRSCPPGMPVFVMAAADAWRMLTNIPLHRRPPTGGNQFVDVPFWSDEPLDQLPIADDWQAAGQTISSTIRDDPVSFATVDREFRRRPLHRRTLRAPSGACAGLGTRYLRALSHTLSTSGDSSGKDAS